MYTTYGKYWELFLYICTEVKIDNDFVPVGMLNKKTLFLKRRMNNKGFTYDKINKLFLNVWEIFSVYVHTSRIFHINRWRVLADIPCSSDVI